MITFNEQLEQSKQFVEALLASYFNQSFIYQDQLFQSMKYSVFSGGKRIRPILFYELFQAYQQDVKPYKDYMVALECIHTYSLIHDDLPSIDNDDLRRGKPTNHKIYGNATALLAGDGLLNLSYEILIKCALNYQHPNHLEAIFIIAKNAGIHGMVGGQFVDIISENTTIDLETLQYIHQHKTGNLLTASLLSAAKLIDVDESDFRNIEKYAQRIGLLFQIRDDILDIEGNLVDLGKPIGSDSKKQKATYPSLLGIEKTKEIMHQIKDEAQQGILDIFDEDSFFYQLADFLILREK